MTNNKNYIEHYHPARVRMIIEGEGGTGKALVLYLLTYYTALLVWMQARIKYSVLDLDPSGKKRLGKQFYDLGNVPPTHDLINELQARPADFPGVEELDDLQALRVAVGPGHKLSFGAQQERRIGKFSWLVQMWWHWEEFLQFLSRPLFSLRSYEEHLEQSLTSGDGHGRLLEDDPGDGPVLKLYTLSTGGGTGAAIGLCQADLHHQICQQVWGVNEYEQRANLILAEAIDHTDERMKANTWETLVEIEERYEVRRRQPRRYGVIQLDQTRPPWVEVTLYNRMNAKEFTLRNREQVLQVVAEVDRMKHASAIASEWHAQFANRASFPPGFFCSAAAAVRLTIETEGMKDVGQVWLSRAVVNQYFLRRLPEKEGERLAREAATAFGQQWGLHQQMRYFDRDSETQLAIKPDQHAFVDERRQDLTGAMASRERDFFAKVQPVLVRLKEEKLTAFLTMLDQAIQTQVNHHGLYHAIDFLDQLEVILQAERRRVQQQIERLQTEFTTWQQLQQQQAAKPKRLWYQYRKHLGQQYQDKQRLMLQERKLVAHQALLEVEWQMVRARRQHLLAWVEVLQQVAAALERRAGQVVAEREANRPICVVNLLDHLDKQAEPRLITQQVEGNWQAATQGLWFGWQGEALTLFAPHIEAGAESLRTEAGINKLLSYARTWFDFGGVMVEEWLRSGQKRLDEWLALFDEVAAPFVTLNQAKHPQPKVIKIIGSQFGAEGYFAKAQDYGWTVKETADPHNVEVLFTWHHLNWRLLSQSESWERAYHQRAATKVGNGRTKGRQRVAGNGKQPIEVNTVESTTEVQHVTAT